MNLSPFVFVFLWLAAMAVLVGVSWWRKWHQQYRAARHTYRAAAQDVEAATAFYGSMNLHDERDWAAIRLRNEMPLDWREATMAELSPEALDPGLGGDVSSPTLPPPGPDQERHTHDGSCTDDRCSVLGPLTKAQERALTSPASLAPVWERLADTGDITAAHATHPHPNWLDGQLAELYAWVRTVWEAA